MRFVSLATLAAVVCATAPAAEAQMVPPFTHEGLFLRIEGGIGYLHSTATFSDNTATAYGGAPYLGVAVGGALMRNFVLYGELWGMAAAGPSGTFGSATFTTNNNITLNYGGIGVGVGYFFMPGNLFLGVSVDATRLGITNHDNGDTTNSDVGGAATITLGKQWWISDYWGLGFSIKGIGGGNRDNNNDSNSASYSTFSGLATVTLTFG